jgi:serine/threonine protein kinase
MFQIYSSRWSLGIILYECLFGYPPFWGKNRRATQKVIIDWKNSLEIPLAPRTSDPAKRLVRALLCGSNERLRTPTWEIDLSVQRGHPVSAMYRMQVFKQDIRNHAFFRTINLDFERVHLEMAPVLPSAKSSTRETKNTPDITDGKQIKTKDIMLHDERVLKERRHGAFKNYTYRGPDLGVVLDRFTKAIDNEDLP